MDRENDIQRSYQTERGEVVAGIAEQFMTNWTSSIFRERCVAQIESVRREALPQANSPDPVEKFLAQKDPKQLEEFVFEKSKTREDYVSLIAEMLMMLRQHAGKPLVNSQVLENASPQDLAAAGLIHNGVNDGKDGGAKAKK
uniref:Mediator of RNA polymerase II transcription subunit 15 n=1 Tax=Arion vulgaris TaxID=1028688 RepID=A0A0B6Z356_9EUPU